MFAWLMRKWLGEVNSCSVGVIVSYLKFRMTYRWCSITNLSRKSGMNGVAKIDLCVVDQSKSKYGMP